MPDETHNSEWDAFSATFHQDLSQVHPKGYGRKEIAERLEAILPSDAPLYRPIKKQSRAQQKAEWTPDR